MGHTTYLEAAGAGALSVRRAVQGKRLLVTGVTGFLGKVWLAHLLQNAPDVAEVIVLIRPKKGESASARLDRIIERSPAFRALRDAHGEGYERFVRGKLRGVEARLTQPLAGLGADAAPLLADIDAVVHFAGLTDFEPDPLMALDANVRGARHAADLAALSRGRIYLHVSTAFVAGVDTDDVREHIERGLAPNGVRFSPERELQDLEAELGRLERKQDRIDACMARAQRLGWPNVYTYTKGLAEHLLEGRQDVRAATFRPSIVECALSYPFTGWNEGVNTSGPIVWLLGTSFQRFPARAENVFDIAPVDTAARRLSLVLAAQLAGERDAVGVYTCASGTVNPFTFGRAVEMTGLAQRRLHRGSGDRWRRNVVSRLDAVCFGVQDEQAFGHARLRRLARATRSWLRENPPKEQLSPRMHRKLGGRRLDDNVRSCSMKCRTADRKLGQIDDMLRQYRPFIHDHDYRFRTERLAALSERLAPGEREAFAFDVADIDWRHYWMDVEVPGLETWSIPILRGEKVPEDEPRVVANARRTRSPRYGRSVDAAE